MTYPEHVKRDIQGFITSAFGHTYHAAYLFLRITDVVQAKTWLEGLIPQVLTAESWRNNDQPCAPGESKPPKIYPTHIINIAFTFEGLAELRLSDAVLRTFAPEFQQGMTAQPRASALGDIEDSAPENWQINNPNHDPTHILLILHAGMEPTADDVLETFVNDVVDGLQGVEVAYIERGYRRDDDKEHFGFRDGIAQPKISGINLYDRDGKPIPDALKTGEFILGYLNEFNIYPSVPVVPRNEDPHDILPPYRNPRHVHPLYQMSQLKDLGANGTYIVYRKLHQNVVTYWKFIADEIKRIDGDVSIERMIWLASKMVGRFPNGDPLVADPDSLKHQDDFHYADSDAEGAFCPFGSHIRRTNPRDSFTPLNKKDALTTVRKHRILRRGRIYGDQLFDVGIMKDDAQNTTLETLMNLTDDGADRGLHFFAVNANIQRQFEFIQDNWVNNPHFNGMYQNKDALIGDNGSSKQNPSYMHIPNSPVRLRTKPLPRFVDVVGGAYLFMPSITALRFLAQS